jgi:hypothetical protein
MKYINADNIPYVFNCDTEEKCYSGKDVKRMIDSMTKEDVIPREQVLQMLNETVLVCDGITDKGESPVMRVGFSRGKHAVLAEVEKQLEKVEQGRQEFLKSK